VFGPAQTSRSRSTGQLTPTCRQVVHTERGHAVVELTYGTRLAAIAADLIPELSATR
jgi:hypothetical protein